MANRGSVGEVATSDLGNERHTKAKEMLSVEENDVGARATLLNAGNCLVHLHAELVILDSHNEMGTQAPPKE